MKKSVKEERVPWIVFEGIDWLNDYLNKDMRVFEWGSGGSTIYFSKRTNSVVSVEHDPTWFKKVRTELKETKIANCEYLLVEPKKTAINKWLPYSAFFL